MSFWDLGLAEVHAGPRGLDVYTPYHPDLVACFRKLGGKFEKPAKRWRIPHDPGARDTALARLRSALAGIGPKGWDTARADLAAQFTTVTHEYRVVVGEPGIRVEVPDGTRAETHLRRIPGIDRAARDEGPFHLWPTTAMTDAARDALGVVAADDWRRFYETTRWMRNRSVAGDIDLTYTAPDDYGLTVGNTVVAEHGFVATADPAYRAAPIDTYVLDVLDIALVTPPSTYELVYRYTDAEPAYTVLRDRLRKVDPGPRLTMAHVASTFTTEFG